MKNLFEGKGLTQNEILDNLKAMAYKQENLTFQKRFQPEEIEQFKDKYFVKKSEVDLIDKEFKEQQEAYKHKKAIAEKEVENLRQYIKTGGFDTNEIVYLIDDQENNIMTTYDCQGNFISSRPLLSNEKQSRIHFAKAVNE